MTRKIDFQASYPNLTVMHALLPPDWYAGCHEGRPNQINVQDMFSSHRQQEMLMMHLQSMALLMSG